MKGGYNSSKEYVFRSRGEVIRLNLELRFQMEEYSLAYALASFLQTWIASKNTYRQTNKRVSMPKKQCWNMWEEVTCMRRKKLETQCKY